MQTIADRYVVERERWGTADDGLVHARDAAGERYLVSVCYPYAPRLPAVRELLARYGCDVVEARRVGDRDVLVEREPPGRPSHEHPPVAPSTARRLGLALGARQLATEPGMLGVRPELVYIDGDRLCGIAAGYLAMVAHNNPTLTGGYPYYPLGATSIEEAMGQRRSRTHDAYVLAYMLRFWLTASPLIGPAESPMQIFLDIAQREHNFHYEGPLADVIDAGFGGAPLESMLEALERADLAEADADHARRAELVAVVVAHPADDGPRFVLADYLLERGDPRGDFIAAQCRGQNVDALLAAHGARWSAYLADQVSEAYFGRGFVGMVRVFDDETFARRRDALLAFGPIPARAPE